MMQFKTIYNKQTYLQSSSKGIITNLLALNLVAAMLVITATTFILFELKPFICFIDSYYYHVIQRKVENLAVIGDLPCFFAWPCYSGNHPAKSN